MNSTFHLEDAINAALRENKDGKNFILFNYWNTITMSNGQQYYILIKPVKNEA